MRVKRNEYLHLALLVGNSLLPTSASPSHLQKDFCTKILRLSKMTPFTRSHSFPPFLSPSRLSYHPLSLPILSLLSLSSLSLFLFISLLSPFSLSLISSSPISPAHTSEGPVDGGGDDDMGKDRAIVSMNDVSTAADLREGRSGEKGVLAL